jgi:carbon-monoxide dehydrogenase medium subunit
MTTLAQLEQYRADGNLMDCIHRAVRTMCTPQLRSYATVGGNLCNASPAADLSVLFVALGGSAIIRGKTGERSIDLTDFFKDVNKTALRGEEMLTAVHIPIPGVNNSPSFARVSRTVVDIAQVNSAVCLGVDSTGRVKEARISLGAVAPTPIRSEAAETLLRGQEVSTINEALIDKVGDQARAEAKPISDIRGTADFRKQIIGVLVKRCIAESIGKL